MEYFATTETARGEAGYLLTTMDTSLQFSVCLNLEEMEKTALNVLNKAKEQIKIEKEEFLLKSQQISLLDIPISPSTSLENNNNYVSPDNSKGEEDYDEFDWFIVDQNKQNKAVNSNETGKVEEVRQNQKNEDNGRNKGGNDGDLISFD
jgi:hypothetical protein